MRTERSILEQAGLASGLLNEEQIDRGWHVLVESLPAADLSLGEITDEQLANQLIDLGYLNRWQADQLRHGRTKFNLGSYKILDAIGHGGMGWVFKGEHELLGRVEAIKVLPRKQTNPNSIECFCREIRAQARLDHPNLVRLTYADQDGEIYFLVTEYVAGTDLRRLVRKHGPLNQFQSAALISGAAEALEYAHRQGLIHRDVKPGNLLINQQGKTKLADLGLAIFSHEIIQTQRKARHIVGTADFLAPEIIVNPSEIRPISDVYSLGCTLYYAVTGKVPYPSGDTADKLRRQLDEQPILPQRISPEIDDEFARLISDMMEKRPADRISTAAEVVARLQPWVSQLTSADYLEIGRLAEPEAEREFYQASLSDTVIATYEADETPSLPPVSDIVPSRTVAESHKLTEENLGNEDLVPNATKLLLAMLAGFAIATLVFILSGN